MGGSTRGVDAVGGALLRRRLEHPHAGVRGATPEHAEQEERRVATEREAAAMRRALELAALGRRGHPAQPDVGCVVLDARRRGRRRGLARARRAGRTPRSPRCAQAGDRARGGTAVVTLEPCAHTGRTGRAPRR